MTEEQRAATPAVDYRPFIIADADTGHGGDAHVRNLIRRFVEVGRARLPHRGPEARREEVRPPGRQGARRPRTSRSSASTRRASSSTSWACPGIIVARTDAEAANLLDGRSDERDQPFILGATNVDLPSYKPALLALMRRFHDAGRRGAERPPALRDRPRRSTPPPTPGSTAAGSQRRSPRRSPTHGKARTPRSTRRSTRSSSRSSKPGSAEAGLKTLRRGGGRR